MMLRQTSFAFRTVFGACLLFLLSSCSLLEPQTEQTFPTRDSEVPSRQRLAQLSFGTNAAFAVCIDPACPQVTPKTVSSALPSSPSAIIPTRAPSPATSPFSALQHSPVAPLAHALNSSASASPRYPSETATHELVVAFPFGASALTPQAKATLFSALAHLRSARSVSISGHTDSVGTPQVNQHLAMARALAVRDYFSLAVPDSAATVSVEAKGDCCFVASNHDQQGRARNRRVHVLFIADTGAS
jgi:outer membrane protein OmpA-like peptidoglycan-associated protein